MKKISLCMIVKNEENNLFRCLVSAMQYVNEIIITDTGSEDKTKTIASQFTNKIFDFPWCNDFSRARNFSIDKASYNWVLILDADEEIKGFDTESIYNFLNKDDTIVGKVGITNLFEDSTGLKLSRERVSRLFNKKYFHYAGIIHEHIVPYNIVEYKTSPVKIKLNHYGYTRDIIDRTQKVKRNITLLNQAISENYKDPYLHYQMGKTYYMAGKYSSAAECFNIALSMGVNYKYEYVEDLIETYGYSLINSEEYGKALELEHFNDIYGMRPDYNFVMGLIYMNNGRFAQAVDKFLKCINNVEGRVEGINSYLSYYNIGVIYECLGIAEQAIEYYKRCGNYQPALNRLKVLIQVN